MREREMKDEDREQRDHAVENGDEGRKGSSPIANRVHDLDVIQ